MADHKVVYVINESNGKKFWNKCGQAYVNADGSINVRLDLLPNAQLQIRDAKPQE
jgi:Ni2+-binding GTPase involved in maturation of urease and hydrogenase